MTESTYHARMTGFEANTNIEMTKRDAQATIISASPIAGSYSLQMNYTVASGSCIWETYAGMSISSVQGVTFLFKFRFDVAPTAELTLFWIGSATNRIAVYLTTAKKIRSQNNATNYNITGATVLSVNTVYSVQVRITSTNIYIRIDNTDEVSSALGFTLGAWNPLFGGGQSTKTALTTKVVIDDIIVFWTAAAIDPPWLDKDTVVKLLTMNADGGATEDGFYQDGVPTGDATHWKNVNDIANTADYNTVTSVNPTTKRETYKLNQSITLTGSNEFIGFTVWGYLARTGTGSTEMIIRDNSTDIGVLASPSIVTTNSGYPAGYWKYRPSDDAVLLTKAMLENTSGNNIEFGIQARTIGGSDPSVIAYSFWAYYAEGIVAVAAGFAHSFAVII